MSKTKRLKTVTAGRLVFAVCYTQARPNDGPKARAAKSKCSSLARQKLNFRYAWQDLWLLLATNFHRGDLFPQGQLPASPGASGLLLPEAGDRDSEGNQGTRVCRPDHRQLCQRHILSQDGGRRDHRHCYNGAARLQPPACLYLRERKLKPMLGRGNPPQRPFS